MTFYTAAHDTTSSHAAGGFLTATMDRLTLILRRRQAYNRTCAELGACTDRDLCDLGIARSDIRRLAREAANEIA